MTILGGLLGFCMKTVDASSRDSVLFVMIASVLLKLNTGIKNRFALAWLLVVCTSNEED